MNKAKLEELRKKHPREALELDLVSGRVSPETGEVNPDHKSDEMQDYMELCVLEVIDMICEQGHSGFSHGYMMGLLIPLLKDLPITPLTGKDWEWHKMNWMSGEQNKRCGRVFRENGVAYNGNGYAFSDNGGKTWFTSIESHKNISFPCSSKDLETEYKYILKGES